MEMIFFQADPGRFFGGITGFVNDHKKWVAMSLLNIEKAVNHTPKSIGLELESYATVHGVAAKVFNTNVLQSDELSSKDCLNCAMLLAGEIERLRILSGVCADKDHAQVLTSVSRSLEELQSELRGAFRGASQ